MAQIQSANLQIPIIAIGGILPEDIAAIMQTGVYGVAASGTITHATNPAQIVKHLYEQLNNQCLNQVI